MSRSKPLACSIYHGTMYRVIANIDSKSPNYKAAMRWYFQPDGKPRVVLPVLPESAAPGEDMRTPRICVAPTINNCLTAIGLLGRLRRCLARNEDAFSYMNIGREVYPVLVQEFFGPRVYKPTARQVKDQPWTHEHWILEPLRPKRQYIIWLGMDSITWREAPRMPLGYTCINVRYDLRPPKNSNHPWINGHGHILDSDEEEEIYYPEQH